MIQSMRKPSKKMLSGLTVSAVLGVLVLSTGAWACGGGGQGGADYVPQQRGQQQQMTQGTLLSADQARDLVSRYVTPTNPDLKIGIPNDTGSYYEVDLFGKNGEKVKILAVDKATGRITPLS